MANLPRVAPKSLKTGALKYETPDPYHQVDGAIYRGESCTSEAL